MQTDHPTAAKTVLEHSLSETRYLARQPILNLEGSVEGYELLFRSSSTGDCDADVDTAARTMLDNAVIFGFEQFTNGLPAFVHCSVEALTERLLHVLDPRQAILIVPSSLDDAPRLLNAYRELKSRSFRLALNDFKCDENSRELLQLADYVRLEFNRLEAGEQDQIRRRRSGSIGVIACHVETQENFKQARDRGFNLFQGSYICHPDLMGKRKVHANRLFHFEIVRELYQDPLDVRRLGKLVLRDASLTYRLLRLVNSPLYAVHQELHSIETAIIILGDKTIRNVISLAVLSEMSGGQPTEILRMALLRARFCEVAASKFRMDSGEQYLLGMFSMLPAMLGQAIGEISPSLPFRKEVCEALQGISNPERSLLSWVECHEQGEWKSCDAIAEVNGMTKEVLMHSYLEAAVWAESALRSATCASIRGPVGVRTDPSEERKGRRDPASRPGRNTL